MAEKTRRTLGNQLHIDLIVKKNNGKRKWRWYEEIREQRTRDIETKVHDKG
jgi:hypothetical protein